MEGIATAKAATAQLELETFAAEFRPVLAGVFTSEQDHLPPAAHDMLQRVKRFSLRDGKRLRPYLTVAGYELFGGTDRQLALLLATVPELLHSFLLIHDDIMDRSATRRGGRSLHREYEHLFAQRGVPEAPHHGQSLALLAGDLLFVLAAKTLSQLPITPSRKLAMIQLVNETVTRTIVGQERDLLLSLEAQVPVAERLVMYEYKTAYYSFVAPLELGALLAEAEPADRATLREISLPLGIAFQLIDDYLDHDGDPQSKQRAEHYHRQAKQAVAKLRPPRHTPAAAQRLATLVDFIIERKH